MNACVKSAFFVAGLLVTSTASAQETASGSWFQPEPWPKVSDYVSQPALASTAYRDSVQVARCLHSDGLESNWSDGPLSDDPEYKSLSAALSSRNGICARRSGSANLTMVSSALAEFRLKDMSLSLADRATSVDEDVAQAFFSPAQGSVTMAHVGRCLAVHSPGLTQQVLESRPGSTAEDAAMAELYGATPECGVASAPEGIATAYQRVALAHGLYVWTVLNSY